MVIEGPPIRALRRPPTWRSNGAPMALPAECGNAPTAALPPPKTPPIDAALMDIATRTPGRLNRAKRLRVLRERAHYIEIAVSATAHFGSTCLGRLGAGKGGDR